LRKESMRRELVACIATTLLFFLSMMFIPILGIFAGIFTPLPSLLFYYRWGRPIGYGGMGGALLLGAVLLTFIGMAQSIPFYSGMLALGLSLGIGMRQHWSVERTIGSSSLVVFFAGALLFSQIHYLGDGNLLQDLEREMHAAVTAALEQYGNSSPETQFLRQSLELFVSTMVRLLPGIALSCALLVSWLNAMVALRFCRLHLLPLPPWGEWSRWKAPEHLVWVLIISGFSFLLPGALLKTVAANILLIVGTVYFLQGLAIVAFYCEQWKLPRVLRAILYGFFLLQQFATLGAVIVGLFDTWFDFRRLTRKPAPD
jgi:uncharacterized protein YybS (DUF2232 family)